MSNAKKKAYKQAIAALPMPEGAIAPTLPERINRLTPSERHDLGRMIRSMKLRKIIKRTLAEAFWAREEQKTHDSLQQLRTTLRARESMKSYSNALMTFEPEVTTSKQPTLIEVL